MESALSFWEIKEQHYDKAQDKSMPTMNYPINLIHLAEESGILDHEGISIKLGRSSIIVGL